MTGIAISGIDPAALAADPAFTGAFAPLSAAPLSLYLPASSFVPTAGTPVLAEAGTSDTGGMLFDPASTETVWGAAQIPDGWATYNVDLWWTNAGAGAGNVVWRFDYGSFGDGESAGPSTAGTLRTVTAPASGTAEVSRMESGITVPTAGELLPIRLRRAGTDAGDTLANDACMYGLRFTKAS